MTYTNHLADETSPYLLQHASNPVDWHPWNNAALEAARQQNKPILLSIGYSACHWCHVMAHESFEDPATAEIMNRLFINIKVDREERPDLDKIYQNAYQLLNQRGGGWPLNVFLTPGEQIPFFAGTYFPPEARYNMPAFAEILERVAQFYAEQRGEIEQQREQLLDALASFNPRGQHQHASLEAAPLDYARQQLASQYDANWAGFGQAPKFPHPTNIERLLRHWAATRDAAQEDHKAREMAFTTLHAMASGGIYDQLGGGFFRYSVDEKWMIPHFEKMLYDNGPLLTLYSDAWQASGQAMFRRIASETGEWVMREMQSPEGGYYATLDADSEGEEGRYYVWAPEQAQALLSPQEFALSSAVYGLDCEANFEGRWHLHICRDPLETTQQQGLTADQGAAMLQSARQKLLTARGARIRPGRDEKILTSWNGLMIKGMATAGRRLQRTDFIASAQRAVDFIHQHLWQEKRLLACSKDGRAHLAAYLDDYAFLIDGLLELLQAQWRSRDLQFALELAEILLVHYQDKEAGGFFFTADDHEQLIQRPKPISDDSLPSGNGIAAQVLIRLAHLTGEQRYRQAAQHTLGCAGETLTQYAYAHGAMLTALQEYLYPAELIILRGEAEAMKPWRQLAAQDYAPQRLVFAIDAAETGLPDLLAQRPPREQVVAYRCSGASCQPAITRLEEFAALFKQEGNTAP